MRDIFVPPFILLQLPYLYFVSIFRAGTGIINRNPNHSRNNALGGDNFAHADNNFPSRPGLSGDGGANG
jgi:hypothetical protein